MAIIWEEVDEPPTGSWFEVSSCAYCEREFKVMPTQCLNPNAWKVWTQLGASLGAGIQQPLKAAQAWCSANNRYLYTYSWSASSTICYRLSSPFTVKLSDEYGNWIDTGYQAPVITGGYGFYWGSLTITHLPIS
jgi:hypothetical protein